MGTFLAGLGIVVLGFGVYQFSNLFGLYSANPEVENGIPWTFVILRGIAYSLMLCGAVVMIIGFM